MGIEQEIMSETILRVRGSATPTIMRCAGSARPEPDEILVTADSDAAALGSAAHYCARTLATLGVIDWESVPDVAQQYGVDAEELRMLCALATKLWGKVSDSFPRAMTEVPLLHTTEPLNGVQLRITGTADGISIAGSVARVWDWKFGFKDHDYSAQLKTYAALVLLMNPELTQCTATILWVRDQEIENLTLTLADALEWIRSLYACVVQWDGVYHTGPQCEWCPRVTCPAARAMVRHSVEAFTAENAAGELSRMTPDQIIALVDTASMVTRYARAARDAVKALILKNGDVVGSRQLLTIAELEQRQLLPIEGLLSLQAAGFDDDDLAQVISLSIGKAEQVVKNKAVRGKGAAAIRELGDKLAAAGAITTKRQQRLVTKRAEG